MQAISAFNAENPQKQHRSRPSQKQRRRQRQQAQQAPQAPQAPQVAQVAQVAQAPRASQAQQAKQTQQAPQVARRPRAQQQRAQQQVDDRPTFELDQNSKIRSGGLLLYRYNKAVHDYEYLMIKYETTYEDIGGKTDKSDKSYQDTVCREVYEETNNVIKKSEVQALITNQNPLYLYSGGRGGHIVYLIEKDIGERDYGDKDIEGRLREIKWVRYQEMKNRGIDEILSRRLSTFKCFCEELLQLENICKNLDTITITPPPGKEEVIPSTDKEQAIPPIGKEQVIQPICKEEVDELTSQIETLLM